MPAHLAAQALELGGPTLALDAACASSLYSVGLACHYLHAGKAELMLAGAVSAADPFFINMGFSIFQAYPDCLLYTSPSPRDLSTSRMPSSA